MNCHHKVGRVKRNVGYMVTVVEHRVQEVDTLNYVYTLERPYGSGMRITSYKPQERGEACDRKEVK